MVRALASAAAALVLVGTGPAAHGLGRQATSTGQQTPTFRASVNLVTLDVIPRTSAGQFVPDLGKDEFQVFEDGVRQTVASLVLVHGGRVFNLAQAPVAAPQQEGIILPRAKPSADAAGRIFVILVDDLHFTSVETPLVRKLLKTVVATLFHPGDMVAMYSTGPSSIELPVSFDHRLVQEAISKVGGHGLSYRDLMEGRDGTQGPQGLRYNAHVAFRTAFDLLGTLEGVSQRRKVVLLVSNGYDFDPFPQGRTGTDQVFGGRYGTPWGDTERGDRFLTLQQQGNRFADGDLAAELVSVTGAANRVNASIYTLDPRGVVGTTSLADNVDLTEARAHIAKTQNSLRVLADATGGFAVVNDNTYVEALGRIDAETSDYYILGYYSSNPDERQRNRMLDVRTTRPGLQVSARGWYRTRGAPASKPAGR